MGGLLGVTAYVHNSNSWQGGVAVKKIDIYCVLLSTFSPLLQLWVPAQNELSDLVPLQPCKGY